MEFPSLLMVASIFLALLGVRKSWQRLRLSRAKHRSVRGHARISRMLAKWVPFYEYPETLLFNIDGVSPEIAERRRAGFTQLRDTLISAAPHSIAFTATIEPVIADVEFINAYRVPFQFRNYIRRELKLGSVAIASDGARIKDLDGNWSYDLSGSYGVNLLGHEFYKHAIETAVQQVGELGPVLGPYHPVIAENVQLLKQISGLDQVSFHMSGTEAVMQAARLARYHSGRKKLVTFCGAYHGWWDGVQPGVGNPQGAHDVYLLQELSAATLTVLRTRNDIAAVFVNPLQALHPNAGASSDTMLVNSSRCANFDRQRYTDWLQSLRKICDERSIVLIFDEVFLGFRLGIGGAQEYFGVRADMVTYGKTLGGGFPVGTLCGKASLMKRYRDNSPTDICFARGTFNSHPYVMAAMNHFLKHITQPKFCAEIKAAEALWNQRAQDLNQRLESAGLPVQVRNLSSVWILIYRQPSRYNWMLQFYLRAEGLLLSWVGTGRLIFSHDYNEVDFQIVMEKILRAAAQMAADGWWQSSPTVTNKSINQQILKEILKVWLHRFAIPLNAIRSHNKVVS